MLGSDPEGGCWGQTPRAKPEGSDPLARSAQPSGERTAVSVKGAVSISKDGFGIRAFPRDRRFRPAFRRCKGLGTCRSLDSLTLARDDSTGYARSG